MNAFLILFAFAVALLTFYILLKNKQLRNIDLLKNNWGKPKEDEYFNFDVIEKFFINKQNKTKVYHLISNQTQYDLDLNDIFTYIDRTTSRIGQQYLYYKIRTIEQPEKLYKFNQLTKLFENNEKLRFNCQIELSKLSTDSAYDLELLVNETIISKPYYHKFLLPLALLSIIAAIAGFFYQIFFLLLIPIFIINTVLHYKTKNYIRYYLSAVSQLNKALAVAKRIITNKEITRHFEDVSFIKIISEIKTKMSFISFEKRFDNEFAALFWAVAELIKIQFNIESLIFYSFIDDIIKKRESINKMFVFIGEIDSAISTASVLYENTNVCKPTFVENKQICIKNMIHPLIQNCIPNDINLYNKSLLLTGSNMSGKTTFIRMLAINSILSQTLYFAFATEFTIPYYKVYSSIRIEDDLLNDTSYYLKEVLTIKKFIDTANDPSPSLFVLDEIFKGTNTIERIAAGKAILSYLNKGNNIVIVSTHDIELSEFLVNNGFDLYHFSEKISDNKLLFDHKLKKGSLKTRNAIKILELYQYPPEIITDAITTEKKVKSPYEKI